jgi:hypothetical protein
MCNIPWQKEAKTVKKEGKKEICLSVSKLLLNESTDQDEIFRA